jgi:hypothetical protein
LNLVKDAMNDTALPRASFARSERVAFIGAPARALTEDRRALMRREDRAPSGPELLSSDEWQALKAICQPAKAG